MTDIDDIGPMKKLDSLGVLPSIEMFPEQCTQAWSESSTLSFSDLYKQIFNIVVCGMGGSRFPPKTIKELFRDRIKEPYEIVEDYTLPAYVDADTLVVLSSFSGTTEEVISCGRDALKRGAKVTGVTQGGDIAKILRENQCTAYIFAPTYNPCGQPRIGSGYLLLGHLGILKALNLIDIDAKEVIEAIEYSRQISKKYRVEIPTTENPAKQLALLLQDSHPFIITSEFLKGFGNGFANQMNETAKMVSDYRYISELNHHLMEGLIRPESLHKNGLFLFFLSKLYTEPIRKRYGITEEVVKKHNIKTHSIELQGPSKLAQTLEAYTFSGFVSYYLAMLHDVDPSKIPWVDYFKQELAKT